MKYKLYVDKDTYVNSRYTNRNYGAEQVLEISANNINGTREIQRALLQLSLGSLSTVRNQNLFPQSLSSINNATLHLINCDHQDGWIEDATLYLYPLTASWNAGKGIGKSFSDYGFCNYLNRDRNNVWTTSGGDYNYSTCASLTASVYLENGNENLAFDVTNLVKAWDNGSLVNNGIIIKLAPSLESGTGNYGYKKVFSENTHTDYYPYITFDYDWEEFNDRNEIWTDVTQRLYSDAVRHYATSSTSLTGTVSAQLYGYTLSTVTANIAFPVNKYTYTSITAMVNSFATTSLTGIWVPSTGYAFTSYTANVGYNVGNYVASYDNFLKKYYLDIVIDSACASFSSYKDIWYFNQGSTSENTFFVRGLELNDYEYDWYVKAITKNSYKYTDVEKIRLVIQNRSVFNLTPTKTANRDFYNVILKEVYYEILDETDDIWITKTLCSRSKEYNWFYLLADQLPVDKQYYIKIYYVVQGIEYSTIAGKFEIY